MQRMRHAGVLLHPTSLPGAGPCGDLGDGALRFLDWLHTAGCGLWQVLPLHPTGGGFSPYDSPSAFAGGTHLLSLDRLVTDGLLEADEARPPRAAGPRVDREALRSWHAPRVARAAHRLAHRNPAAVAAYADAHPWCLDVARHHALCAKHGVPDWRTLPAPLRDRRPDALAEADDGLSQDIAAAVAAELLFDRQWRSVRQAAAERGIRIIGDVPIFVGTGSADVWAQRALFRGGTAPSGWAPDPVTGVPPDYFSPMGQRWGNPHYDWPAHAADGFRWWVSRFERAFALTDVVRVDHFRGFAAAWEIPAADPDARNGTWAPAPGDALFRAVRAALGGLPLIAEDLGEITPDVRALRDRLGLPGMKILQFAFGGDADHTFLPHTWTHTGWAAYTGTHDNDTAAGWYATAGDRPRHRYRVYAGRDGQEPGWDLIRLAWASIARFAITPMQDVLGLGSVARMNTPGTVEGNWTWRAPALPAPAAARLRGLSEAYGRLPPPVEGDRDSAC
jgi:4-alpha-glucanotransferase